jgi:O-methyltransferase involved in polyketide biosynthesis
MAVHAIDRLGDVPQTLLIPLVARADARRRWPRYGFADAVAERVVARLEAEGVDLAWVRKDHPALRSLVVRAAWFDRQCAAFCRRHPDGTAISLGVGLDTRRERLAALGVPAGMDWRELDLPDVVAVRRAQLGELAAATCAGDALSEDWLADLPAERGRPLLVVMEGLLMYLPRAGVETLLRRLVARQRALAAPLVLLFDAVSPFVARAGLRYSTLRFRRDAVSAARLFQWGLSGSAALARIDPALIAVECVDLTAAAGGPMALLMKLRARLVRDRPHYAAWRVEA